MAVSTTEPLCQPCGYHEAFRGKSQHHTLLLFQVSAVLCCHITCVVFASWKSAGSVSFQHTDHSPKVLISSLPGTCRTVTHTLIDGGGAPWEFVSVDKTVKEKGRRCQTDLWFICCVVSGATGEEAPDAGPSESRAGGPGDAVSLRAAGPPRQGSDAAGTSLENTCIVSTQLIHFTCKSSAFSIVVSVFD